MTIGAESFLENHRWGDGGRTLIIRREGFWRAEEVEAHFRWLPQVLNGQRARHGAARVLVDFSGTPVQSQENAERLRQGIQRAYKAGDQVAIVLSSTLLGMQVRRNGGLANVRYFASVGEAEEWLSGS